MLIFGSEGRLGNQIFQYAFLKSTKTKNEKIIVFGFEELKSIFKIEGVIAFNKRNRFTKGIVRKIIKPLLHVLAKYRVISSIQIKKTNGFNGYLKESTEYQFQFGLIKKITFVYDGTFHSQCFFNPIAIEHLTPRVLHINLAKKYLNELPQNAHKVFVHIRRGDYKEYTVYGKSALLPYEYFEKQIKWFESNICNNYFIFLSDEPEYIKANFSNINNKIVIENSSMGTDFALMTLCDSGILSPSSFGWWGSYMMSNRNIVIAPKYWLGFNSQNEYPESPYPSFAKLADSNYP